MMLTSRKAQELTEVEQNDGKHGGSVAIHITGKFQVSAYICYRPFAAATMFTVVHMLQCVMFLRENVLVMRLQ